MKILITTLFLGAALPVNAYESIRDFNNRQTYESQKGYAYEKKCFRYEYREKYIPGSSISRVMSNLIMRKLLSHAIVIATY